MLKGTAFINSRRVHKRILELQHAGKTEQEIADAFGFTPATVRYVISLSASVAPAANAEVNVPGDHKARRAYEMHEAGKSFHEISRVLQIDLPAVRRMVHRYTWALNHSK